MRLLHDTSHRVIGAFLFATALMVLVAVILRQVNFLTQKFTFTGGKINGSLPSEKRSPSFTKKGQG